MKLNKYGMYHYDTVRDTSNDQPPLYEGERVTANHSEYSYPPALFTRALIERSEGTGCWHCLSGFASSARVAVE